MRKLHGFLVFAAAALGCGTRGAGAPADGGSGDAPVTQPAGRRSFDVTAALGPGDGGPGAAVPPTNVFTLVLAAAERRMIVGSAGNATVVPVTTSDGKTFRSTKPFGTGVVTGSSCEGITSLTYKSVDVTLTGETLTGHATGSARISCGDCALDQPFSAVLSGTPDKTAPFLVTFSATTLDPFSPFGLAASEPLPATATARLVAGDGSHVDLLPSIAEGEIPLVTGFTKPDVVLRFGDGYTVALDGLVDFAGRAGSADASLRLAGTPAPPLAMEDGFESAVDASVGGARVVTEAAFVIAGARSLYVGGNNAPALGTASPGLSFAVRLAVHAGDTKVRLSARGVSGNPGVGFGGQLEIGSVGHAPSPPTTLSRFEEAPTATMLPNGKTVFLTAATTTEVALPADVSDEVIVSLRPSRFDCGPSIAVGGLIMDDLRVE